MTKWYLVLHAPVILDSFMVSCIFVVNPFIRIYAEPPRFAFGHNFVVFVEHFKKFCWQRTKSDQEMVMTERINDH